MDVKDDIVGVQPPNFSVKRYDIIASSAKRDGNTSIVPILWIPHSNGCTTCELRAAKSKGGRPKMDVDFMGNRVENLFMLYSIRRSPAIYKGIRNDCKSLEYLMNEYLASTNPKARSIHDTHKKMPRCKRKSDAL